MKTLIFELFSGVGLCNQLFSLETAIYLAHISQRKLILLILNPLCHCGKSSWDYGYLLNFFTNDFLTYLPNGFDVFYQSIPPHISDLLKDEKRTVHIKYTKKFSSVVFVDSELDTKENQDNIKDFLHYREKENLKFRENSHYENFYITQSNASRCFYNFYTTEANYLIMRNICASLKFKPLLHTIADHLYNNINSTNGILKNNFNIFVHLRFGDYHKDANFLTRFNNKIVNNLTHFFDGHKTNLITPQIYGLIDNTKNVDFFDRMSRFRINLVEGITKGYFPKYLTQNKMLFNDFHVVKNNSVVDAIIEMLLCVRANTFIGTATSTFSNYIQYLRYIENKSSGYYSNIEKPNVRFCQLIPVNSCSYEWKKYGYNGGHPISWHYFWKSNLGIRPRKLFTIHGKTDGFGSQLQACLSLMAYCEYNNYEYIHTPFTRMQHNDNKIASFPMYMNNFINIENSYRSINDISEYEKSCLYKVKEGPFVHGSYHPEFFYTSNLLETLRKIYFSKSKPDLDFSSTKKNIAVHIRRGDVNSTRWRSRWTSNQEYIDLLHTLDKTNSVIHIYSEGVESDFKDIKDAFLTEEFVFHLNEEVTKTFHGLVIADVLILSKSSFSYCAGLINKNKVIGGFLKTWWHKPLKQWL